MSTSIRRVVTGVDEAGKSVVYENTELPPVELAIMAGVQMYQVWGTEGQLVSPVTAPQAANHTFFPGPGGTRFGLFRIPPETPVSENQAQPDAATLDAHVAEAEAQVPGLLGVFEPDAPGMHQTTTIDYVVVIEGELWVELDDGVEVHLPTGTCVVQNGARHAWRNHGTAPGTLAYVIVDADSRS
jgi:hypothetical protein